MIITYKQYLGITLGCAFLSVVLVITGLALPTWIQLCDQSSNFFGANFPLDYGEVCIVRGLFEFGFITELSGSQTIQLPKSDDLHAVEATAALMIVGCLFTLVGIGLTSAMFFRKSDEYGVQKRTLMMSLTNFILSSICFLAAVLIYTISQASLLNPERNIQSFFKLLGTRLREFNALDNQGFFVTNVHETAEYGAGLVISWIAFVFSFLTISVAVSALIERNKLKARESNPVVFYENKGAELATQY